MDGVQVAHKTMSTGESQPRQYETRLTEEDRRFLVESSAEIAQILRRARDRSAMFTASFGNGAQSALTSVLDVDAENEQIIFDLPGQKEIVPRLLAAENVTFVAYLDGIKIKFQIPGLESAEFDGGDALSAPLPDVVVRLQRREYFRVNCPLSNPPRCAISWATQGESLRADFDIVDLSLGGLALMVRPGALPIDPGTEYPDCTITLPGEGTFVATLVVRNVRNVEMRSGQALRVGCSFVRPPADGITRLQRYTMKIERERKAKLE